MSKTNCPNCGAPIQSEQCPYCGTMFSGSISFTRKNIESTVPEYTILFDSRDDAEAVLNEMRGILDIYGCVTVADLYDLSDITTYYTLNKYGWIHLNGASVMRAICGYTIVLPNPIPIG